jgi:CTP-dependent riboflavin kinase
MGLNEMCPGTLNVRLDQDYQMQNTIVLLPREVNDVDELVLQRCRVGGFRCVLVRPYRDQPHPGWNSNPPNVLEIMSERLLCGELGLAAGSPVEVEVEGTDAWWFKLDE